MKKLLLTTLFISSLFAEHGKTDDKDLQLALQGKYNEAFQGFKKRCDLNDGYACGMAGYFYNKGFGVKEDIKKAIQYYKKGCSLNDSDSCTFLGYFYYKGDVVKKDLKKAIKFLKKACNELKSKDACNYLKNIH